MPKRCVWVTRTAPEAEATASRVRAMGHAAVVEPVLEARAIPGTVIDLADDEALAFTSGHALAAFAALSGARGATVFAVGAATAARARAAGFADVRFAEGGARALAALIAAAAPRQVLHPAAREPAADLVALLAERGVPARAVPVYETAPTALAAPPAGADAVLIHSLRAAGRVAALLQGRRDLEVFAISEAAAAPLRELGLARVAAAASPTEAALLDLLNT